MAEGQGHPPAAAMASYRRSRLPFARPQTLQTLQKSAQLRKQKYPNKPNRPHARGKSHHKATAMAQGHSTAAAIASYRRSTSVCHASNPRNPPKVRPTPQAKGTPTSPTGATPAGKSHHKATAMAEGQGHPPAAAMASYRRSRLPFARPQTLQTLQKSAQLRKQKYPNKPNRPHARGKSHHKATAMAQGHSTAAAIASYRRSTSVCQASNAPNPPKIRPTPQGKGTPTSPTRATPAGKSHHKATAMAQGHPTAAAMASYRRLRLPFARPQTLQILQKSAQLRRQNVHQQAQHAPRPQAKATTRPQQWLKGKGTPRPQQWLLIGVQGCRLPGLKRSKPSKSPPNSASKSTPTSPTGPTPGAKATTRLYSNGSRALHGVRADPCPFGRRVQLLAA